MKYVPLVPYEFKDGQWLKSIERDIFVFCLCRVEGKEKGWDSAMSSTTAALRNHRDL